MKEEIYNVFRKTFHVPNEWKLLADMQYLVTHSYVKEQAKESFVTISKCLKRLGYMEDNNMMIHDYLHYMILDLLDKNEEVFLTENEIRGNNNILRLCAGNTPDFILKKKGDRQKTCIIDIYVGDKPSSEIKGKYKTLGFFADFYIVTQYDFASTLKQILPSQDIDYLYKNFQVFLTEYYYWRACIKLQKILLNDIDNITLRNIPEASIPMRMAKEKYTNDLAEYAAKVASQDNI